MQDFYNSFSILKYIRIRIYIQVKYVNYSSTNEKYFYEVISHLIKGLKSVLEVAEIKTKKENLRSGQSPATRI